MNPYEVVVGQIWFKRQLKVKGAVSIYRIQKQLAWTGLDLPSLLQQSSIEPHLSHAHTLTKVATFRSEILYGV